MGCSDVHNGISTHNANNVETWEGCTADRKPGLYMTMTYRCDFEGMTDDMGNPSNPSGSSGSSGGGSSGTGDPNYDDSGNNTSPCANGGVLDAPQGLTTDPGDGNCSGIPTLPNLPDPKLKNKCDKAKAAYENQAVKASYETLKTKTSEPKETGFGFKKVTNPDGSVTTGTFALNPDANNADGMKMTITPTTFAYTHTHLDKTAGKIAIKIHSPTDIDTFISILRSAKANGIPLSEVSAGMISSDPDTQYNVYQLIYTGDGNDLPPEFSDTQLAKLRNEFNEAGQRITIETGEPLTHYEMQGLFFKTMKKMNVKNVVLSKREYNTGKYYIVEFDEYGNPTETPCP